MLDQAARPDFKRAQDEALKLLASFGYDEPPVDPVRIANDLGVSVVFAKFAEADAAVSGFYDPAEDGIYVNSDEYPRRQTFTVAHELGHRMLHLEWAKSNDYKVLRRDDTERYKDPKEIEADTFAAHLLVPKSLLRRYYKIATVQQMSDLFLVSAPVIKNRLKYEFGV